MIPPPLLCQISLSSMTTLNGTMMTNRIALATGRHTRIDDMTPLHDRRRTPW